MPAIEPPSEANEKAEITTVSLLAEAALKLGMRVDHLDKTRNSECLRYTAEIGDGIVTNQSLHARVGPILADHAPEEHQNCYSLKYRPAYQH